MKEFFLLAPDEQKAIVETFNHVSKIQERIRSHTEAINTAQCEIAREQMECPHLVTIPSSIQPHTNTIQCVACGLEWDDHDN